MTENSSQEDKIGWTTIPLQRLAKTTTVHTTEVVDDVLFCVTAEYDEPGKLARKIMIRADLCKA